MTDPTTTRAQMLEHCLALAALDADYAIWAAQWYEANEPALLANLARKVAQAVARADASVARPSPITERAQPLGSKGEGDESRAPPGRMGGQSPMERTSRRG